MYICVINVRLTEKCLGNKEKFLRNRKKLEKIEKNRNRKKLEIKNLVCNFVHSLMHFVKGHPNNNDRRVIKSHNNSDND